MTARVLASTVGMDRAEWLATRRRGIGASDAAAVCGVDPWKGPLRIWAEKIGLLGDGDETPSESAFWGKTLGPVIAAEFTARTGIKVRRRNAILQSDSYPWMLANLDRETIGDGENIPVEIKAHSAWRRHEWADDQCPIPVIVQVHHQMLTMSTTAAWVVGLLGGQELAIRRVERDPEIVGMVVDAETEFWAHVQAGTMPPAVHETDADLIEELHPYGDDVEVGLDGEGAAAVAAYRDAHEAEKAAEADKAMARARVCRALGGAHVGLVNGRKAISWKPVTSSRLDLDRARLAYPELAAFEIATTSRRLTLPHRKAQTDGD